MARPSRTSSEPQRRRLPRFHLSARSRSIADVDTLRAPAALASLVAANVTPLAGILLFGWSPASLLILYYVDTFLGLKKPPFIVTIKY